MTGFKNLETSSSYAIRGFFEYLYKLIPEEYRIHYKNDEATDCFREFFDQDLSFENRLHYKLAKLPFNERKTPWVAIMWNTEGLFPSDENYRRYDVKFSATNDSSLPKKGKACLTKMPITLAIISNSMTALMEFEEVYLLNVRPEDMALSLKHPVLDEFSVNIMNGAAPTNIVKMPRAEGTLCQAMASVILQFPIVGVPKDQQIIRTIRADFRYLDNKEPMFDSKMVIIGGDTPTPTPEPDESVTDLLYHSVSDKITGFNDGEHGYIQTYKTIPLRHVDIYEVCIEVDPTKNNLPEGAVDFSIMYNFNIDDVDIENLGRLQDNGIINFVGKNCYMSPRISVEVPTTGKYIIKLEHKPVESQFGFSMGEFTYSSYTVDGYLIATQTNICVEPNDEDLYIDYNTVYPDEWHVAGIYTENNSYIKINNEVVWELQEEVEKKHIPTVED